MPAISRIQVPRNLTGLAYDNIKRYLLEGGVDEHERLTEEFLSNRLGISKSPVREALNSLETEGLLRIEPRRGAFLRRFSVKEVKDLYDLREVLEVYAVSIASITPQLIVDLRSSIKRTRHLIEADDKIGHIEEDMVFHGIIAAAGGNAELCRVLKNVQNQIWLCRCKTYDLSSSTAVKAHRNIVDALGADDRKEAQIAMRNHIALVRNRLIEFLSGEAAVQKTLNGKRKNSLHSH